ncbi:sensor histidine kinase [Parafrankia elaeagni]|uniref:sensor histidine kinase n=1 Tax=Parafrankia elaeagni TaxID=222534 RepID=UPI000376EAE6|nr:histidine kinase [Parafrankia elaeagni]
MSVGLTPAWASLREQAHARPPLVDCLVVLATFGTGLCAAVATPAANANALALPAVVLGMLAALVLLLRRRWPLAVLAATAGLRAVGAAADLGNPVLLLAIGVAIYTVAVQRRGAVVWYFAVLAGLASTLASLPGGPSAKDIASTWTWLGLATLAGYSVRGRRDYIVAVEDRARRAEQGREQEARRQVAEERLRIARELHDVVGHHVALIKVQSAVAAHVLRTDPDRAEESLGHVRQASRTVLDELSSLVRVLREPDEPIATRPARGLAHLDELVAGFAASGLPLSWSSTGPERELPALVDLAAYRIVQESLTNAYKHGDGGHTRVRLAYDQHDLRIQVRSGGPPTGLGDAGPAGTVRGTAVDVPGTTSEPNGATDPGYVAGHGIIGMRERAAALGGQLHVDRDGDGAFTIAACLPLPPPAGPGATTSATAGAGGEA